MDEWSRSPLLLIEYDVSLLPDGETQYLRSTTALSKSFNKDPAGAAFHRIALIQAGLIEQEETSSSSEDETESSDLSEPTEDSDLQDKNIDGPPSGTRWKKAKKPKNNVKTVDVDYYKVLGLEQERWMATEDQVVKAYRKVCLKMHPDKFAAQGEDAKAMAEEKFKEIQQAYEVLSNETSRRLYDSTDTFDDTLPMDCDPVDFFKVYGPAFRRYARWSVNRDVPELGDEETPWEEVSQFYDFWYAFKSWREYPHPDEEDPAQAECREHKRWIERQNMKLREKAKKDEGKRIRKFVDSAFGLDPRVSQQREAEKQARIQKKKNKAKAREEAEAVERQVAEREAAAAKEQEEAKRRQQEQEKKEKEIEKRALKEQRKRLRDLCNNEERRLLDASALDYLCGRLDRQKLEKLSVYLEKENNLDKCKAVLKHTVDTLERQEKEQNDERIKKQQAAAKAYEEARQQDSVKKKKENMKEWSEEELKMLDKALNKFPQGTRKRWDQVANYIRTRTLDEVLQMVKERQGASSKRFEAQQNWRAPQKEREIASAPTKAEESFTDVQIDRSKETSADKKTVNSAVSGSWSKEQELALVKALKAIGKEATDRWDQIAQQVPGKTKAECFRRFKELRESFKASK